MAKTTNPFLFELGDELEDVITGFKGFCIYRIEFLTGCNQYGLQPKKKATEKEVAKIDQFDENRLKATGNKITLPNQTPIKKVPGGPVQMIKQRSILGK